MQRSHFTATPLSFRVMHPRAGVPAEAATDTPVLQDDHSTIHFDYGILRAYVEAGGPFR